MVTLIHGWKVRTSVSRPSQSGEYWKKAIGSICTVAGIVGIVAGLGFLTSSGHALLGEPGSLRHLAPACGLETL